MAGPASEAHASSRRRVVIVGAGFGGLAAARKLRKANVDVTLVERTNHHLFQPLLYQVALGGLSASDCASPIRQLLRRAPNTTGLMAEVRDVDVQPREVVLDGGARLPYDSLILACGARTSYFGHEEWRASTCAMKTLADAVRLRERFYGAIEQAELERDPAEQARLLRFVIIGGGPTGVEVAGQVAVTAHAMRRDFRRIDTSKVSVVLLDAGERLISSFSEKLSATMAHEISELGVQVREGALAPAIDPAGVTFEVDGNSERIESRTVIWAAGVRPVGLVERLAGAIGSQTDRAGRIEVGEDLTLPEHPEISVIGDIALLNGPDGRPLPGLATVAIQQARHVAKAIRHGAPGASTPFKYLDKGALAVCGPGRAVCAIKGVELSGHIAFLTYLTVHLYYLGGVAGRRLEVLIKWIGARFGQRQSALIAGELPAALSADSSAQEAGAR
jgi:NADH:quinone reductase (non-electrogenic)